MRVKCSRCKETKEASAFNCNLALGWFEKFIPAVLRYLNI